MIESQGRTLEEAIESGLNQLGLAREDTDITVLDEATKGFLGFGARPARVLLTEKLRRVSQAEEEERIAREDRERREREKELRRRENEREASIRAEKAERAARAESTEKAVRKPEMRAPRTERTERADRVVRAERPAREAAVASAPPVAIESREGREGREGEADRSGRGGRSGQRRSVARPPRPTEPREAKEARAPREPRDAKLAREKAFSQGKETDLSREAKEYLESLLKLMDVSIEVAAVEIEGGLYINASGPDAGTLIGYRGETLDALQYLVSLKVNKGEEDYQRVSLDAEDYRAKREEILIKLAQRLASKAVKTGRKVALEPMNPYERRILHSALQGHPSVRTHSEGSDPYRRVVITPKSVQRRPHSGPRSAARRSEGQTQPSAEAQPRIEEQPRAENRSLE